jgi:stage II sporulation protein AB (anti-sigma F factor)
MALKNHIRMFFASNSENIGIARIAAAAFAAQADFTISELDDIKVAISEAVSNAIIHGYGEGYSGGPKEIEFAMNLYEDKLEYIVKDYGKGIEDIELACTPSYSSDPERMGLGFVFMKSFMDDLDIESKLDQGTTVRMTKKIEHNRIH